MLGSIFVGLSGMDAFSNALKRISNNITNINTDGYTASGVTFDNLVSQSRGDDSGDGVVLADPHLNFSEGELRQTNQDLDLAVDGSGFLVLNKDGALSFIRTGSFEVSDDGYIVLQGTKYQLNVLDSTGQPKPISIDAFRVSPPQKTTHVTFSDNLSSTATSFTVSSIQVYDTDGAADTWQASFTRDSSAPAGQWTVTVTNAEGTQVGDPQTLQFDNGVADPQSSTLTFSDGTHSVDFDFSAASSFSAGDVSTLQVSKADGYGLGEVSAVQVNDKGELEIAYTNSQTKSLGAVALASFGNPSELEQNNAGIFTAKSSLHPSFLPTSAQTAGKVVSRQLEASNVDLSQEFGELILVQRGFQASSQIVSVSNDMIQQLFGMRGQG